MIDLKCPNCGEELTMPPSLAGQEQACPKCGKPVAVPRPAGGQAGPGQGAGAGGGAIPSRVSPRMVWACAGAGLVALGLLVTIVVQLAVLNQRLSSVAEAFDPGPPGQGSGGVMYRMAADVSSMKSDIARMQSQLSEVKSDTAEMKSGLSDMRERGVRLRM